VTKDILSIWRDVLAVLRKEYRLIFTIHLVYVALGFVLFSPLTGLIGQLLLGLSGQSVLSDLDIAYFLFTPVGMLALTLFAALIITILIFEQTSLMVVCAAAIQGQHLPLMPVLTYTAGQSKRIFLFAIHLILRLLFIILPFLAVCGAIGWFLLTEYDINYYLAEKPPEFFIALITSALVVLPMMVVLVQKLFSWPLTLPLLLFNGVSPSRSFRESAEQTAGNRRIIALTLGIWAVAVILLSLLVLGTIQLLGSMLAPLFFDSITWLIPVLGGLVALLSLANLLLTAFTSGSFATLLVKLCERSGVKIKTGTFATDQQRKAKHLSDRTLALFLGGGVIAAFLVGYSLLARIPSDNDIMIIAHRGAAGTAPENTMASVRQAIEDGTDWIEIDVQESSDGKVVVIHDSDFMKLAGVNLKVWDTTLQQIKEIDVGSWFSAKFSAERVPTLTEVLEEAKGKARVLIELKYYGHDQQLEQRVTDVVEQTGMVDEVAIMSLKYDGITKFRTLRPDWSVGLLSSKAIGKIADLDVNFLAINMAAAKPAFIRHIHSTGKQVYVWTVNDQVSLARMTALGVDGLITDEPALAREVLARHADLTPVERLLLHTATLLNQPLPQQTYRDQSP
jgi:glycerophosphoryl diester phosphodiesterase